MSGAGRDGLVVLTSHGVAACERWLVVPYGEGGGSSLPSLVGVGDGVELGVGDDAGAVKVEC